MLSTTSAVVCALLNLVTFTSAFVTPSINTKSYQYVKFEELRGVPQGWMEVKHADPATPLVLRLAMRPLGAKANELAQTFFEIANPLSSNYGKFLDREALSAFTSPPTPHLDAVKAWLADYEVTEFDVANEWIVLSTDVGTAEKLLDTTFNWYKHVTAKDGVMHRDQLLLRTLGYSVPATVAPLINLIQPTTRFGQPGAYASTIFQAATLDADSPPADLLAQEAPAGCVYDNITAGCLRSYYGVDDFHVDPVTAGTVAFASFLEEYARYEDLRLYEEAFLPNVTQSFEVVEINGGLNDQDYPGDSGEANLDLQMMAALANPLPIIEYSVGGRGPLIPDIDQPNPSDSQVEPYLPFVTYLLSLPNEQLPHTLSISYGESEQELPVSYMRQVCNAFMQLGARGVSVLVASGDFGPGSACLSNDGKDTLKYLPAFPASCPFVTTVGGTYFFNPETAVPFSGGGFSETFPRPAYQQDAVLGWLNRVDYKDAIYYNATGRAYPDVAALGSKAAVFDKGELGAIAGTSMSSPVFAAIVGNLNAARLAQGKSTLGFLNPWLYSLQGGELKDITTGGSVGCTGTSLVSDLPAGYIPFAGFNATEAWDPVTGLGTPRFGSLVNAAVSAGQL